MIRIEESATTLTKAGKAMIGGVTVSASSAGYVWVSETWAWLGANTGPITSLCAIIGLLVTVIAAVDSVFRRRQRK